MEDLFRQRLKQLQSPQIPKSFSEALLDIQSFYPEFPTSTQPIPVYKTSEKREMIQSLQDFVSEHTNIESEQKVKIEGGEIVLKTTYQRLERFAHPVEAVVDFDKKIGERLFANFNHKKTKILFAVDKLMPEESFDLTDESELGLLKIFFPEKVAVLFQKMIKAMGLQEGEYFLFPVDEDLKLTRKSFYEIALSIDPILTVTLGAKTTKSLLDTDERLTTLHGQFLPRPIDQESQLLYVPLFHPSILESNANMKKSAWVDMQKMMEYLKNSV